MTKYSIDLMDVSQKICPIMSTHIRAQYDKDGYATSDGAVNCQGDTCMAWQARLDLAGNKTYYGDCSLMAQGRNLIINGDK